VLVGPVDVALDDIRAAGDELTETEAALHGSSDDSARGTSRIELPLARHALELVEPSLLELQARPCDEILDGSRDEHLARTRSGRHTSSDVDGDSGHFSVLQLALAGVNAGADLE